MAVSGDDVQQFVDRLVDEDHHALSTADLLETTSSRPRSALSRDRPEGGAADGRPLRPSATDQRSPRLSGRPEFADQTAAKRKWDVRVQEPGPTAGAWSEPWCDPHQRSERSIRAQTESRGLFWDAAEQNAEADNREGAGVNLGAFTLFLLDKEAKLSCLLLQRPLELDPHPGPDQVTTLTATTCSRLAVSSRWGW
jgi:hypothetical protein